MTRLVAFLAGSGLLVLAVAAAVVTPAAAGSSRVASVACGDVITADTMLVRNLMCAGDGLTVTNGAQLDLRGFRVRGIGTGRGITVLGTGTVLRNGFVTGFDTGVYVGARSGRIEDLVVKNNTRAGIFLDGFSGESDIVQRNTVQGNGIGVQLALGIRFVQVLDNIVVENAGDGIIASNQDDGSLFDGNRSSRNGGNGLNVADSIVTIRNNVLNRNALDGLRAEDLPDFASAWLIAGNQANYNGGHGLEAMVPGMRDGGGNHAFGNGLQPQCVNLGC